MPILGRRFVVLLLLNVVNSTSASDPRPPWIQKQAAGHRLQATGCRLQAMRGQVDHFELYRALSNYGGSDLSGVVTRDNRT